MHYLLGRKKDSLTKGCPCAANSRFFFWSLNMAALWGSCKVWRTCHQLWHYVVQRTDARLLFVLFVRMSLRVIFRCNVHFTYTVRALIQCYLWIWLISCHPIFDPTSYKRLVYEDFDIRKTAPICRCDVTILLCIRTHSLYFYIASCTPV